MQTDLQTLLMITGAVCAAYIIVNMMKRRRKGELFDLDDEMDQRDAANERTLASMQSDPLMEGANEVSFEKHRVPPKKVIIDHSIAPVVVETQAMPEDEHVSRVDSLSRVEHPSRTEYAAESDISYVALTVMAIKERPFSGELLFDAFKSSHFYYGKDKVFHRHLNDNPMQHTLYSVLSMVEPGTFDIDTMSDQTFSGVVLLMTLSNRMNPLVVFEKMLNSARQLAVTLGAELCDASRKPLTAQMMTHLRESIQKTHRRSLTHISSGASV